MSQTDRNDVNTEIESPSGAQLKSGQRLGKIGAELLLKAAICAAMIALIAGMAAAFLGS